MRRTVGWIAGGDRDADDFIQLSLVEILRSAGSFRGESSLETWADRISVRTSRHAMRKRRDRSMVVVAEPRDDDQSGDDDPARRLLQRDVARALAQVPLQRRVPLVLKLVYQYSVAEIAEMTETRENTVRDRLQVGRRELRKAALRDPALRSYVASWGVER
ncbi:MAG: RNA polymerase sigma factor [Myxococcales bacterium]|nr:RNA polymerase sigma factor [Myxococcales bacterium]